MEVAGAAVRCGCGGGGGRRPRGVVDPEGR